MTTVSARMSSISCEQSSWTSRVLSKQSRLPSSQSLSFTVRPSLRRRGAICSIEHPIGADRESVPQIARSRSPSSSLNLSSSSPSFSQTEAKRSSSVTAHAALHGEDIACKPQLAETPTTPDSCAGSVLGAIALITGTSVGAGILALPQETSPAGFIPSASLLVGCWAFLTLEAFLIAEVNINLRNKRNTRATTQEGHSPEGASDVISLRTMAEETLGPVGGWLSSATYVFLSYTLMVAYIAKAADVTTLGTDIPYDLAAFVFAAALGGVVYAGNTNTTDWINRIMTGGLLVLFGVIVCGGTLNADWSQLEHQDWSQAPAALPVLFLSLVFHDLIPVLCAYLNGDAKKVRLSIGLGGALPLAMFLIWDAVALSLSHGVAGVDPLEALVSLGGPAQGAVVQGFSLLAIMTSFIGTALSMSEFFIEQLDRMTAKSPKSEAVEQAVEKEELSPGSKLSRQQGLRASAFGLVLLPSVVVACSTPDAFFAASEAAGAYGMTVLYGIFPPLMYWKSRQSSRGAGEATGEVAPAQVSWLDRPAGGLALASMAACAFSVIVSQALLDTAKFQDGVPMQGGSLSSAIAVLATTTPVSSGTGSLDSVPAQGTPKATLEAQSLAAPRLSASEGEQPVEAAFSA